MNHRLALELYAKKQILVLGLGLSGQAASRLLLSLGAFVSAVERCILKDAIIDLEQIGLKIVPESEVDNDELESFLKNFDLIVVSPGIPQTHFIYEMARKLNKTILGEIALGCSLIRQPVIGITGSNGKTTVTSLIAHVLNESGRRALALGNIGIPLTQSILENTGDEILVLELSSYQLETLEGELLDAALLLNITPNHLDRYKEMQAYAEAKCRLNLCLKKNAPLFVYENVLKDFRFLLNQEAVLSYGYDSSCELWTDLESVQMSGLHQFDLPSSLKGRKSIDLENCMAAYAICNHFGVTAQQFLRALTSFKKPSHRIEFVCEHSGVFYFDDSKGTNLEAVSRAVESMKNQVLLIAGGVHKGSSYKIWIDQFKNKVKMIFAIGEAAQQIFDELNDHIPVRLSGTLENAVLEASQVAVGGDSILLSPGCASFDQFKNYEHRGDEFKKIVHSNNLKLSFQAV